MNKEIIIFINIVHFILIIKQLIAVFNDDMNNVLIIRVLLTSLITTLINAGIEEIDHAVAYAVATVLLVLSFIKRSTQIGAFHRPKVFISLLIIYCIYSII